MNIKKHHITRSIKYTSALCFLITLSSCGWMKPSNFESPPEFSDWNLTRSQKDTLSAFIEEFNRLRNKNSLYEKKLRSNSLDIVKLHSEIDNLGKTKAYLEEDIKNVKSDLDFVERQFISFENRIQSADTKASGVAAQAEAIILLDKTIRQNPSSLDSITVSIIKSKLSASDESLKNNQYAAAVYYAKRAQRLITVAAKKHSLEELRGNTLVVASSAANVRSGPGSTFEVVDKLIFGTIVRELVESGKWKKIKTKTGREGWIHASLLK